MKFNAYTLLYILPLLLLFSCGKGKMVSNKNAALARVDTDLAARNPTVRDSIVKDIAAAKDSMTRFEFESRLAKYYYLSPTPDSLLPIVERVENFAKGKTSEERGRLLLAYAYNIHAIYYHAFHLEPERQKDLYRKSYNLIMESADKSEVHKIAANLGDAYAASNELPKAAWWYRRALFLVDSLQLPEKENSSLYMGLAGIYQQLGDNDNALKYYRRTEKIYKRMSVSMQAYFLNNFGSYYYYLRQYDKSLQKFLALRSLLEKNAMQDNFDMYLCKINLADVYLNLGDTQKASALLDDVEPFAAKHGDKVMLYYSNTIRIGIAVKEKDWNAVRRLTSNDAGSNAIPFQLRQIRANYMRDYYISTGNYAQAYRDLVANNAYSDSLEHNRNNMRTADIMTRFTADTLRLHHDLQMQSQKLAFQRVDIAIIVAVTLVVVLVLLLMLYVQRTRKRLAEDRVKIMDLRLQGARIRISPHFIFNVLNNHIIATKSQKDDGDILQLSKLIRENLNVSREVAIPLSDELGFVRQYVRVEQPIVGDDFDFSINVSDNVDIGKVLVPSMMVQILVENAFAHALSGWEGHKMLRIDIAREGYVVKIMVTDNGKGFNPAALSDRLHNGLNIIRQTIAVLNSRSKRKIIFNIENVTDGSKITGCRSTIAIPDGSLKRKGARTETEN